MSVASDGGDVNSFSDQKTQSADLLAGRRILIVEDDPFIALALEETLTELGLVVVGSARNVSSALLMAGGP